MKMNKKTRKGVKYVDNMKTLDCVKTVLSMENDKCCVKTITLMFPCQCNRE